MRKLFTAHSLGTYEKIRTKLEAIIELCGAKGIVLLIDEWSSISLNIQPYFAEMIRKTIAISDKIFLKIMALKYFTKSSVLIDPPQRIGFQQGIDISLLADLDQLLNFDSAAQNVKDFLVLIAYKHAIAEKPNLASIKPHEFEKFLCELIFDGPKPLLEIVRASEGNPRDFLAILISCGAVAQSIKKPITEKQIISIAGRHFLTNKAPEIKNHPAANRLFDKIFKQVIKTQNKLFFVSTIKAEMDERIQELWHYRFIHLRDSNFLHINEDGLPQDYSIFSMDYGKLLSLKATKKGEDIIRVMDILLNFTVGNSLLFALDDALSEHSISKLIREPLIPVLGVILVSSVEEAKIEDIEAQIETSVIDHLLEE